MIVFRADISRPMWQGSVSDGLINVLYLSDQAYAYPKLVRDLKTRMPALLFNYGHASQIDESNWRSAAWCLDAYLHHFDGVLPWQSLGSQKALVKPTPTALIVDAGDHGIAVASLRLHALRYGAQLAELLRMLESSRGWSRERIALLVHDSIPVGNFRQRNEFPRSPMAASSTLDARGFIELKQRVLHLLEQPPL